MHLAVMFSSIWAEKGRNNMAIGPSYRAFYFIFTVFFFHLSFPVYIYAASLLYRKTV